MWQMVRPLQLELPLDLKRTNNTDGLTCKRRLRRDLTQVAPTGYIGAAIAAAAPQDGAPPGWRKLSGGNGTDHLSGNVADPNIDCGVAAESVGNGGSTASSRHGLD